MGGVIIKLRKELECFIRAILYPESKILFASNNGDETKNVLCDMKNIVDKQPLLQNEISEIHNPIIKFKNGSSIEVLSKKKEESIIRGKRANINPWLYDFESPGISNEELDEVLKPFMVENPPSFKPEYDCIWCSSRKENDI